MISDVHLNKDALNAAFVDMEKRGVDKIVCLGDIVTKYIYPREVVEALIALSGGSGSRFGYSKAK